MLSPTIGVEWEEDAERQHPQQQQHTDQIVDGTRLRDNGFDPPSLPPRVKGNTQGSIVLTMDFLVWNDNVIRTDPPTVPCVRAIWWGETGKGTLFRPRPHTSANSPIDKNGFIDENYDGQSLEDSFNTVSFPIRCSPVHMLDYIQDATWLNLKVYDSSGQQELGSAKVNLLAFVHGAHTIDDLVPIWKGSSAALGKLHVVLTLQYPPPSDVDPNGLGANEEQFLSDKQKQQRRLQKQKQLEQQQQQQRQRPRGSPSPHGRGYGKFGIDPAHIPTDPEAVSDISKLLERSKKLKDKMDTILLDDADNGDGGYEADMLPVPVVYPDKKHQQKKKEEENTSSPRSKEARDIQRQIEELEAKLQEHKEKEAADKARQKTKNKKPARSRYWADSDNSDDDEDDDEKHQKKKKKKMKKKKTTKKGKAIVQKKDSVLSILMKIRSGHIMPSKAKVVGSPNCVIQYRLFADLEQKTVPAKHRSPRPQFDYMDVVPRVYSETLANTLQERVLIFEVWHESKGFHPKGKTLIGLIKIPMAPSDNAEDFLCNLNDADLTWKQINRFVIHNGPIPVYDPFTGKGRGEVDILVAIGPVNAMQLLEKLESSALVAQKLTRGIIARKQVGLRRKSHRKKAKRARKKSEEEAAKNKGYDLSSVDRLLRNIDELDRGSARRNQSHPYHQYQQYQRQHQQQQQQPSEMKETYTDKDKDNEKVDTSPLRIDLSNRVSTQLVQSGKSRNGQTCQITVNVEDALLPSQFPVGIGTQNADNSYFVLYKFFLALFPTRSEAVEPRSVSMDHQASKRIPLQHSCTFTELCDPDFANYLLEPLEIQLWANKREGERYVGSVFVDMCPFVDEDTNDVILGTVGDTYPIFQERAAVLPSSEAHIRVTVTVNAVNGVPSQGVYNDLSNLYADNSNAVKVVADEDHKHDVANNDDDESSLIYRDISPHSVTEALANALDFSNLLQHTSKNPATTMTMGSPETDEEGSVRVFSSVRELLHLPALHNAYSHVYVEVVVDVENASSIPGSGNNRFTPVVAPSGPFPPSHIASIIPLPPSSWRKLGSVGLRFKVWARRGTDGLNSLHLPTDQLLGAAFVPLEPLKCGFSEICGWYHIYESNQSGISTTSGSSTSTSACVGQIYLSISPGDSLSDAIASSKQHEPQQPQYHDKTATLLRPIPPSQPQWQPQPQPLQQQLQQQQQPPTTEATNEAKGDAPFDLDKDEPVLGPMIDVDQIKGTMDALSEMNRSLTNRLRNLELGLDPHHGQEQESESTKKPLTKKEKEKKLKSGLHSLFAGQFAPRTSKLGAVDSDNDDDDDGAGLPVNKKQQQLQPHKPLTIDSMKSMFASNFGSGTADDTTAKPAANAASEKPMLFAPASQKPPSPKPLKQENKKKEQEKEKDKDKEEPQKPSAVFGALHSLFSGGVSSSKANDDNDDHDDDAGDKHASTATKPAKAQPKISIQPPSATSPVKPTSTDPFLPPVSPGLMMNSTFSSPTKAVANKEKKEEEEKEKTQPTTSSTLDVFGSVPDEVGPKKRTPRRKKKLSVDDVSQFYSIIGNAKEGGEKESKLPEATQEEATKDSKTETAPSPRIRTKVHPVFTSAPKPSPSKAAVRQQHEELSFETSSADKSVRLSVDNRGDQLEFHYSVEDSKQQDNKDTPPGIKIRPYGTPSPRKSSTTEKVDTFSGSSSLPPHHPGSPILQHKRDIPAPQASQSPVADQKPPSSSSSSWRADFHLRQSEQDRMDRISKIMKMGHEEE